MPPFSKLSNVSQLTCKPNGKFDISYAIFPTNSNPSISELTTTPASNFSLTGQSSFSGNFLISGGIVSGFNSNQAGNVTIGGQITIINTGTSSLTVAFNFNNACVAGANDSFYNYFSQFQINDTFATIISEGTASNGTSGSDTNSFSHVILPGDSYQINSGTIAERIKQGFGPTENTLETTASVNITSFTVS